MAFGGLFRRMTPGLEVMHCKEGSVFNYTSGIGDHGHRWTCLRRYGTNPDVEHWQNAIDAPWVLLSPTQQRAQPCDVLSGDFRVDSLRWRWLWGLAYRGAGCLLTDPGVKLTLHGLLNDAKQVARRVAH